VAANSSIRGSEPVSAGRGGQHLVEGFFEACWLTGWANRCRASNALCSRPRRGHRTAPPVAARPGLPTQTLDLGTASAIEMVGTRSTPSHPDWSERRSMPISS